MKPALVKFKKIITLPAILLLLAPLFLAALPAHALYQGGDPLAQARQDDQKQCTAEANGAGRKSGFGNLGQQAGSSLSNVISKGLQKNLSNTVNNIFNNQLPNLVKNQIQSAIPQMINDAIGKQLPGAVNARVSDLSAQGLSGSEIKAQMPQIIVEVLQELIKQILDNILPGVLGDGLRQTLPDEFALSFKDQLPEIINSNPDINASVDELTKQAVDAGHQIPGSTVDADQVSSTIHDGLVSGSQDGLAASNGVFNLADQMIPTILSKLLPQIIETLLKSFSTMLDGLQSSGALNTMINHAGAGVSGGSSGFDWSQADMSQGMPGEFFNPIVSEMAEPVGLSVRNTAFDLQQPYFATVNNPDGTTSQYLLENNTGSQIRDFQASGDIDYTKSGFLDSAGASAAGGVNGDKIGAGINWGNIGDGAKQGLSNGLSGSVGDLVSGVPIVGNLLAPFAESITKALADQALGIGVTGSLIQYGVRAEAEAKAGLPLGSLIHDIPLSDIVVSDTWAVVFGLTNSNFNTSQISQHTGTSNANEKTDLKLQNEQKSLLIQTCTYEKITERVTLSVEKKLFVDDPNARKSAWLAILAWGQAAQKFLFSSHAVSSGNVGVVGSAPAGSGGKDEVGQPAVANLADNIQNNQKDKTAVLVDNLNKSGNPYAKEAAQRIAVEQTKKLSDTLEPPAVNNDNDPTARIAMLSQPNRNYYGTQMMIDDAFQQTNAAGIMEEALQYVANQGYNDTRTCTEWVPDFVTTAGKHCVKWQILTPGSTNAAIQNKILTSPVDFLQNSQTTQSDFATNEVTRSLDALPNLVSDPSQHQKPPAQTDPCPPGPAPCQNSGWQPGKQVSQETLDKTIQRAIDIARSHGSFGPDLKGAASRGFAQGFSDLINKFRSRATGYFSQATSGDFYSRLKLAIQGGDTNVMTIDNPMTLQNTLKDLILQVLDQMPLLKLTDEQKNNLIKDLMPFLVKLIQQNQ